MLELAYDGHRIIITDDPTYTPGSADNVRSYTHEYFFGDRQYTPASRHAVQVLRDDHEIASCILMAVGGATGVHEHSALVYSHCCVLAVGPFMVSLAVPSLELAWAVQVDFGTCFGVHHSTKHRCYISHGELEIARVSYDGEITWRYTGSDIFTNGFALYDDYVEAIDWDNGKYRIEVKSGQGTIVTS